MAAARRYAIASYDPTGLARVLYTRPVARHRGRAGRVLLLAAGSCYAVQRPQADATAGAVRRSCPTRSIHWTGHRRDGQSSRWPASPAWSRWRGASARAEGVTLDDRRRGAPAAGRTLAALWYSRRASSPRPDAATARTARTTRRVEPLYRRRWLIHALTIWGFLGLLAATSLDYGLDAARVKETGTPIPIWYPSRLIGTVGGLMLMYGVTMFMVNRWRKYNRAATDSTASDWLLLALLGSPG